MIVNDYRDIKDRLNRVLTNDIFKDILKNINETIDEKLKNPQPTFIIYGTYNSGKSTLLNALFGKEIADVGDIPTTKEIHEHKYNGFTIYDTPGLNANNEDDIVSQEHLKKSDGVIFVLNSDGSIEDKYIYETLCEILKDNKKLVIIINNKIGNSESDEEKIRNKIQLNLMQAISNKDLKIDVNNIQIIKINALSALNARLNNKNKLLEHSGFFEVENAIKDIMENSSTKDIDNTLKHFVEDQIKQLSDICDSGLDNEKEKKIAELITSIEKQKDKLVNELTSKLNIYKANIKDELMDIFSSENVKESDISNLIHNNILKIQDDFKPLVEQTLKNVANKIDIMNAEFSNIDGISMDIDYENFVHNAVDANGEPLIPDDIKNNILNLAKDKDIVANISKTALEKLKTTLPELMKGKGKVWIEKTSQMLGKYAGPVINVANAAYDIYKANKEHEEMLARERNKRYEISSSSKKISNMFFDNFKKGYIDLIENQFNNILIPHNQLLASTRSKNTNFIQIKEELFDIKNHIK